MADHALIERRVANALFPDAKPKPSVASWVPGVRSAIDRYSRRHGGLWVGGRVSLYEDRIEFEPNALNRAVQLGLHSISVSLESVDTVTVKWAPITSIVTVATPRRDLVIRLWRGRRFADEIRRTRWSM